MHEEMKKTRYHDMLRDGIREFMKKLLICILGAIKATITTESTGSSIAGNDDQPG